MSLRLPFDRNAEGVSDFSRPNPAFFPHLEQRIADLRALGIEADLILSIPTTAGDMRRCRPKPMTDICVSSCPTSAYRNVWWSMANEFDLMHAKTVQDFDRFFHIVEQHDPDGHLRSVHYSKVSTTMPSHG